MSTTWQLISRRPSSNTANSPHGPAPMMSASVEITSSFIPSLRKCLELLFGNPHAQAVECVGDFDLAGQSARIPHVESEIEHVFLHLGARAHFAHPFGLDIDMAGCAGAGAAAIGI